jgi:pyrroline-5-carboxylate reductase
MRNSKITFIGGGNMATSLVGGLVKGDCDAGNITVADPDEKKLEALYSSYHINTEQDNNKAAAVADVIVLAVKPQALRQVSQDLSAVVQDNKPLIISIAAGIRVEDLQRWLGGDCAIVRVMPNTPALVQSGASALFANILVSAEQKDLAESIMRAVGLTIWLDNEELMDPVTALSGSGPAYFFLIMEALEEAVVKLGLPRDTARLLTLQTTFGAAKMALESSENTAELRERVTSPGGTTEQAIQVFEEGGLRELIDKAVKAACQRSDELAKILGKD